jgi:hypothetical protein
MERGDPMRTYRYTDASNEVVFIIEEDGTCIYSTLASEIPDGTEIEPYVPPPMPVPVSVTRFQALAVLAAGGYLDTIRSYINGLDPDNVQRLAWENAADWERTSPTLNALAAMLGLSDAQVDDLFIAASNISA